MAGLVERARATAADLLAADLPRRWLHVQGVARRVATLAHTMSDVDVEVVSAAALLHDVGYAPKLATTGFHALDGASFLRDRGFPIRVCALVAHHSCAYREAEVRGLSAELSEWVDEQTAIRDALWWADMTTTPNGEVTSVHDRITEIQERYGPDDLVTFFIRQAKPELIAVVERVEKRFRK